ncbi:MAG: flagellar biosynthesis protein FlgJ [Firmicutes bacterium]|nr:flagellar biosynthesis protein FlgJ [Bacillota bacterium]
MEVGAVGGAGTRAETAAAQRMEAAVRRAQDRLEAERDLQRLREAAADFEALFLQQLFSVMRRSVPQGGLFEKSFARQTYEDMFFEELAKVSAQAGGLGLADMLMEQLGKAVYDLK